MDGLIFIFQNTEFARFLCVREKAQLRQSCHEVKDLIDSCYNLTWLQMCRLYHRQSLHYYIPSVVPISFWTPFWLWCHMFVTLSLLIKWTGFNPLPASSLHGKARWRVVATVSLVYDIDNVDDEEEEEDDQEDEFISVGVSLASNISCQYGVSSQSLGYHSDDGLVYMDSLVVAQGEPYGVGDEIRVGVDYKRGSIFFQKNNSLVANIPLHGEMLSSPLHMGVQTPDKERRNVMALLW